MSKIETRSTSRGSAVCNPIVLREGEMVRLVFLPSIVDNRENPRASVDGCFVYQRKARSGRWLPVPTTSLATMREGEEFKVTLHAQELRTLLEGLVPLYRLYDQKGIPAGQKTFVEVGNKLGAIVSKSGEELQALVGFNSAEISELLVTVVKWLASSSQATELASKLASLRPDQMPSVSAILGLAALKETLAFWKKSQRESNEEFWQQSLTERSFVLSQVFAYPIIFIAEKAYVGGKQIEGKGGKYADFLVATESTEALAIIEIKTPLTKLLGNEYRTNVYPFSNEMSGALSQAVRYRQSLMRRFDSITSDSEKRFTLGEPRCLIIAGSDSELQGRWMKESFELLRERLQGVTIITYDELFRRVELLVEVLEARR